MAVLTGIDVLGIQRYVFGSNRLRDVLAASWMVDHVTRREQLDQWPGCRPSGVLLAAGGNAVVEFASPDAARTWAARYTRWLQDTAPGLDSVVAHRAYEARPLAWALRVLQVDLARAKLDRLPNAPQLGLSVTASCSITGLPATAVDQGQIVSPGIERLRRKVQDARLRWADFVPPVDRAPGWTADFPDEIDHMGRTHGQTSLVGVVHVDGNGVGELIKRWLERCSEAAGDDEAVRTQYREWSDAVARAGRAALDAAIRRIAACIEEVDDHCIVRGTPDDLAYRLHDGRDDRTHRRPARTVLLPLRPVLLGGDDLTFLCDGRIALDLAVAALEELERHPVPHLGEGGAQTRLTGCAGVALVKAHAPLSRGGSRFDEVPFLRAFLAACRGCQDSLPVHYPRATDDGRPGPPSPEGESFRWFVANERSEARHALPDLATDDGLPTLASDAGSSGGGSGRPGHGGPRGGGGRRGS